MLALDSEMLSFNWEMLSFNWEMLSFNWEMLSFNWEMLSLALLTVTGTICFGLFAVADGERFRAPRAIPIRTTDRPASNSERND